MKPIFCKYCGKDFSVYDDSYELHLPDCFELREESEKIIQQMEKDKVKTKEEIEEWADKLAMAVCDLPEQY